MKCWSCGKEATRVAPAPGWSATDASCVACGAIQPPDLTLSHFARLGVPPEVELDEADLNHRFRELSRELHPDRHSKGGARERRLAMEQMTAVNDAYRVLKDRVKRAEYLLSLHGVAVGEERIGGTAAASGADNAFLMEILELREEVEAAARDAGRAEAMARRLEDEIGASLRRIGTIAREHQSRELDDAARRSARQALTRLKYMQSALADLVRAREKERTP